MLVQVRIAGGARLVSDIPVTLRRAGLTLRLVYTRHCAGTGSLPTGRHVTTVDTTKFVAGPYVHPTRFVPDSYSYRSYA